VISEDRLEQARTAKERAASVLREAESRLTFADVASSVEGVVEGRWVEPGEYKREGDELLSVVDLSTVEVCALVPEGEVANLDVGIEGEFQLESGPQWLKGRVSRVSPSTVDPNRFFDVFLKVDNKRANAGWLMRPGMYADVRVARRIVQNVLAVRDDMIVREGNEQVVYAVEEGTARFPVERAANPTPGFLPRLKRGWTRLLGARGKPGPQRYEERQVSKARRALVSPGLREGEFVQIRQGDIGPDSLLIVNVSDDIRDGTVVRIVKGGP